MSYEDFCTLEQDGRRGAKLSGVRTGRVYTETMQVHTQEGIYLGDMTVSTYLMPRTHKHEVNPTMVKIDVVDTQRIPR